MQYQFQVIKLRGGGVICSRENSKQQNLQQNSVGQQLENPQIKLLKRDEFKRALAQEFEAIENILKDEAPNQCDLLDLMRNFAKYERILYQTHLDSNIEPSFCEFALNSTKRCIEIVLNVFSRKLYFPQASLQIAYFAKILVLIVFQQKIQKKVEIESEDIQDVLKNIQQIQKILEDRLKDQNLKNECSSFSIELSAVNNILEVLDEHKDEMKSILQSFFIGSIESFLNMSLSDNLIESIKQSLMFAYRYQANERKSQKITTIMLIWKLKWKAIDQLIQKENLSSILKSLYLTYETVNQQGDYELLYFWVSMIGELIHQDIFLEKQHIDQLSLNSELLNQVYYISLMQVDQKKVNLLSLEGTVFVDQYKQFLQYLLEGGCFQADTDKSKTIQIPSFAQYANKNIQLSFQKSYEIGQDHLFSQLINEFYVMEYYEQSLKMQQACEDIKDDLENLILNIPTACDSAQNYQQIVAEINNILYKLKLMCQISQSLGICCIRANQLMHHISIYKIQQFDQASQIKDLTSSNPIFELYKIDISLPKNYEKQQNSILKLTKYQKKQLQCLKMFQFIRVEYQSQTIDDYLNENQQKDIEFDILKQRLLDEFQSQQKSEKVEFDFVSFNMLKNELFSLALSIAQNQFMFLNLQQIRNILQLALQYLEYVKQFEQQELLDSYEVGKQIAIKTIKKSQQIFEQTIKPLFFKQFNQRLDNILKEANKIKPSLIREMTDQEYYFQFKQFETLLILIPYQASLSSYNFLFESFYEIHLKSRTQTDLQDNLYQNKNLFRLLKYQNKIFQLGILEKEYEQIKEQMKNIGQYIIAQIERYSKNNQYSHFYGSLDFSTQQNIINKIFYLDTSSENQENTVQVFQTLVKDLTQLAKSLKEQLQFLKIKHKQTINGNFKRSYFAKQFIQNIQQYEEDLILLNNNVRQFKALSLVIQCSKEQKVNDCLVSAKMSSQEMLQKRRRVQKQILGELQLPTLLTLVQYQDGRGTREDVLKFLNEKIKFCLDKIALSQFNNEYLESILTFRRVEILNLQETILQIKEDYEDLEDKTVIDYASIISTILKVGSQYQLFTRRITDQEQNQINIQNQTKKNFSKIENFQLNDLIEKSIKRLAFNKFYYSLKPNKTTNSLSQSTNTVNTLIQQIKDIFHQNSWRIRITVATYLLKNFNNNIFKEIFQRLIIRLRVLETDQRVQIIYDQHESQIKNSFTQKNWEVEEPNIAEEVKISIKQLQEQNFQIQIENDIQKRNELLKSSDIKQNEVDKQIKQIQQFTNENKLEEHIYDNLKQSMQEIKETLKEIQLNLNSIMTDIKYIKGKTVQELLLIRQKRVYDQQLLFSSKSFFIPIQTEEKNYKSNKLDPLTDLFQEIDEFLDLEPEKQSMLIHGQAGSGKSTISRKIEEIFWDRFTQQPDHQTKSNQVPIVPIMISLPSLKNPTNSAIEETLKSNQYGFNKKQIQDFMDQVSQGLYRILFIMDSYDELKSEYVSQNLLIRNNVSQWKQKNETQGYPKCITTTRSEILNTQDYYEWFLSETKQINNYKEIRLVTFNSGAISMYLKYYSEFQARLLLQKSYFDLHKEASEMAQLLNFSNLWSSIQQFITQNKTDKQRLLDNKQIDQTIRVFSKQMKNGVNNELIKDLENGLNQIWSAEVFEIEIEKIRIRDILETPFMMEIVVQVLPSLIESSLDNLVQFEQFSRNFVNQIVQNNNEYLTQMREAQKSASKIWQILSQNNQMSKLLQNPSEMKKIVENKVEEKEREIVTKALIGNPLRRIDFYDLFIDQYFERQVNKLKDSGSQYDSWQFKKEIWKYAIKLAKNMTKECITIVEFQPKGLLEETSEKTWQDFFFDDSDGKGLIKKQIRSCLPLKCKFFNYQFNHKSIQEYLVAKDFLQILETNPIKQEAIYQCLISQTNWNNEFFNGVHNFVIDRIIQDEKAQQKMYEIILMSAKDDQGIIASSNCLFLLNKIGFNFRERQLQKIKIRNVDLRNISFYKSDLSESDFDEVILYNANLSFCKMNNSKWVNLSINQIDHKRCTEAILQAFHINNNEWAYISKLREVYNLFLFEGLQLCQSANVSFKDVSNELPKEFKFVIRGDEKILFTQFENGFSIHKFAIPELLLIKFIPLINPRLFLSDNNILLYNQKEVFSLTNLFDLQSQQIDFKDNIESCAIVKDGEMIVKANQLVQLYKTKVQTNNVFDLIGQFEELESIFLKNNYYISFSQKEIKLYDFESVLKCLRDSQDKQNQQSNKKNNSSRQILCHQGQFQSFDIQEKYFCVRNNISVLVYDIVQQNIIISIDQQNNFSFLIIPSQYLLIFENNSYNVFDYSSGIQKLNLNDKSITSLSYDAKYLAIGQPNTKIRIFRFNDLNFHLFELDREDQDLTQIQFSLESSQYIALGHSTLIVIWDLLYRYKIKVINLKQNLEKMQFITVNNLFFSSKENKLLKEEGKSADPYQKCFLSNGYSALVQDNTIDICKGDSKQFTLSYQVKDQQIVLFPFKTGCAILNSKDKNKVEFLWNNQSERTSEQIIKDECTDVVHLSNRIFAFIFYNYILVRNLESKLPQEIQRINFRSNIRNARFNETLQILTNDRTIMYKYENNQLQEIYSNYPEQFIANDIVLKEGILTNKLGFSPAYAITN